MYYPIIRTKQFDLLALNMVVAADLLHDKIVPVLEPVKDSAALKKTVELLDKNQHPFFVIDNPSVGAFKNMGTKINPFTVSATETAYFIDGQLVLGDKVVVEESIATAPKQIQLSDPMNFGQGDEIVEDEFFSDAQLFFAEDGFVGFADYGLSGATYYDKGYPQKYVTLHIVYLDSFRSLRIKHFRSVTNVDYGHVPEKFFEAAAKLEAWVEKYRAATYISPFLDELLDNYRKKHFPGLGVIKKLTMAHHLACLNYYFSKPAVKRISKW